MPEVDVTAIRSALTACPAPLDELAMFYSISIAQTLMRTVVGLRESSTVMTVDEQSQFKDILANISAQIGNAFALCYTAGLRLEGRDREAHIAWMMKVVGVDIEMPPVTRSKKRTSSERPTSDE